MERRIMGGFAIFHNKTPKPELYVAIGAQGHRLMPSDPTKEQSFDLLKMEW